MAQKNEIVMMTAQIEIVMTTAQNNSVDLNIVYTLSANPLSHPNCNCETMFSSLAICSTVIVFESGVFGLCTGGGGVMISG